jgi:hypothetical protein
MKKLLPLSSYLLVISILFVACDKKKNETNPKNYFRLDEKNYELAFGILENYGKYYGDTAVNIDLSLFSPEIKIDEKVVPLDSITGTGAALYFEAFSTDSTGLVSGDYTYDATESGYPWTFDYSVVIHDYNIETEMGPYLNITSGKINVTRNGDNYKITFNCFTADGKNVTGTFEGKLDMYDYTILYEDYKSKQVKKRGFMR